MPATKRPDIFISATSGDLTHIRETAKQALLSIDCHPVEQANFSPDYREVEQMLRDKINDCDAVLHIVGIRYGAEPDPNTIPDGEPRRSYTQMEAEIARELGKKLYIFLCPDAFCFGDFEPEPEDKHALQQAYRWQIASDKQLFTQVTDETEASLRFRELKTQLEFLTETVTSLERTVTSTRKSHRRLLTLAILGLAVLCGITTLILHLNKKTDQQADSAQRIEDKLDQTLDSFSRERELLTKVLDTSLKKNAAYENLTPEQRFDTALRQIALQNNIPADELKSTLDIYTTKVKALGEKAESLDLVLVAQKERQFARSVQLADQGLSTLEQQDAELKKAEQDKSKASDQIRQERQANLLKRHELLMAKARSLRAQYLFKKAAQSYQKAEELLDPATYPDQWAFARYWRVFALERAGTGIDPEQGNQLLRQSAALTREFLSYYSKDKSPKIWGIAQHSLGSVLEKLSTRLPGKQAADALSDAQQANENALTIYTKEQFPWEWAMGQTNLGNVLISIGKSLPGKQGADALTDAQQAHENALTIYTKEQFPQQWALTQTNLANVLNSIGKSLPGKQGADALRDAQQACENALTIYTKERLPQEWAKAQTNLGAVLISIGKSLPGKQGADALRDAQQALENALTIYTKERLPQKWALTHNSLGAVLANLSKSLPGKQGADALRDAQQAYENALTIYTKEQLPEQWALTQTNLADVLNSIGKSLPGKQGADALRDAQQAYENALTIYTKEQFPKDWRNLQIDMGNLQMRLHDRRQPDQLLHLKAAFQFYENGLDIHHPENNTLSTFILEKKPGASYTALLTEEFPLAEQWARAGLKSTLPLLANLNLAHALLFQGKYQDALAIYQKLWNNPQDIGTGHTFRQATIADFEEMAEKNLTHPDLPKLKKALGIGP
ncbi:DUF4062 domain-containing protein [Akkermansiaceae bacterium]|nr:DUF4062 domain-containing protein [Akkermansiaceae bacterium]